MKKKLPFKITPTVKRYINEIFDFCSGWEKEQLDVPFPIPEFLNITTLQKDLGEKFTTESENNRCDFIHFLEKEGVIRYFENPSNESGTVDRPSGTEEEEGYPTTMVMKILDIKPLQKIKEGHPELFSRSQTHERDSETTAIKRLITKDEEGNFFYGKTRKPIPFRSKDTKTYKLFVSIYDLTHGNGGDVSYGEIIKHMNKYYKLKPTIKKIQDCINNSLMRKNPKRNLAFITTQDKNGVLWVTRDMKHVTFLNPEIK